MTTQTTRKMVRPRTFTEAIMAGSLSDYAAELLRRVRQGCPLTLAEYMHLEQSLAVSPPMNLTDLQQPARMPQDRLLHGQPRRQACVGRL